MMTMYDVLNRKKISWNLAGELTIFAENESAGNDYSVQVSEMDWICVAGCDTDEILEFLEDRQELEALDELRKLNAPDYFYVVFRVEARVKGDSDFIGAYDNLEDARQKMLEVVEQRGGEYDIYEQD